MNEYLFKLKKDGKAVGYIEIYQNGNIRLQYDKCSCPWSHIGWKFHLRKFLDKKSVTSIHPFVTKDKHGKDVFAGDKVIYRPPDLDELCQDEEEQLEASVVGGFLVFDIEGTDFVEASKFGDIELIEGKEDG